MPPEGSHLYEHLSIYGVAFAALLYSLRVEHKKLLIKFDDLPEKRQVAGEERSLGSYRGADILLFGGIVAILVHLTTVIAPAVGRLLSSASASQRINALVVYTSCVLGPILLMYVYSEYCGFRKDCDLARIQNKYATDQEKKSDLERVGKLEKYVYLFAILLWVVGAAIVAILQIEAVPPSA